jgi:membrane protein YdbS with pleckstrin-like domain
MQSCDSSFNDRAKPPGATEVELWWGGYAGRTMWPSFVLTGLVALAIIIGAWYGWVVRGFDPLTMRYGAYAIIGCLAAVQFGRWGQRIVMWNYRVTTRHLYIERSFINKRRPAFPLARVRDVAVVQDVTNRMVNVGLVRLVLDDGTTINLPGVYEPAKAASLIKSAIDQARSNGHSAATPSGDGAPRAAHQEGSV